MPWLYGRKTAQTFAAGRQTHDYYKGVPSQGATMADSIAQNMALAMAYVTDLQKVQAAAYTVASYAAHGTYGIDVNKYYRSPFGVFCSGVYNCARTAWALGWFLDYMGYPYAHTNEDQYCHQWGAYNGWSDWICRWYV